MSMEQLLGSIYRKKLLNILQYNVQFLGVLDTGDNCGNFLQTEHSCSIVEFVYLTFILSSA